MRQQQAAKQLPVAGSPEREHDRQETYVHRTHVKASSMTVCYDSVTLPLIFGVGRCARPGGGWCMNNNWQL
jgi:hypothetical protein